MSQETIAYKNIDSPLGMLIAGGSTEGCCFLEFEDRGGFERIKTRVEKRYRRKVTAGSNKVLDLVEAELEKYFLGELKVFTVPLDIKGTPFEKSVWGELLKISYGETRSYGEIAAKLGKPGASRAVGRANGANYIGIIVPCHRVIEANGNLRGYGGGLWRKQRLLEFEKSSVAFSLS